MSNFGVMTKGDHINHWKTGAIRDADTARYNLNGGQYVPALFFFHLATEKLLKALWIKANPGNTPPFTHDLQKLATLSELQWSIPDFVYLAIVQIWNIEARYPDYIDTLYKQATVAYLKHHEQKIEALHQWLLSSL